MSRPLLSLIVAVAENGVIGRENQLPWHLPNDLKHFKALTLGKPVIMGRKTWESIGRPLPGRTNIVVTRSADWRAEGAVVVHSLEAAIEAGREALEFSASGPGVQAETAPELIVMGGGELYRQALPLADRIYLTRVAAAPEGDAWFPELSPVEWSLESDSPHEADERHAFGYCFQTLQRRLFAS